MPRRQRLLITPVGLCLVLLGPACAPTQHASEQWALLPPEPLSPNQRAQFERAVAARDDLFGQLMNRLQSAIEREGAASAIGVCHEEAPKIARTVAETHKLSIGRTSWKLRNPKNRPPAWATDLVNARIAGPSVLAHPDGRLGVLLPILLKDRCLTCHGPADAIPAKIRSALRTRYPDDQATGFAEGDLRGWFWVEVPSH